MKVTVLTALLLAAGLTAAAAQTRIDGVDILAAGLYKLGTTKTIKDSSISTGQRTEAPDVTLIRETTTIPAKINTVFGVNVQVRGRPNGELATLHIAWHYPEPGLHNPDTGVTKRIDEYDDQKRIGAKSTFYWNLAAEWTLVPGEWVFEIWSGNRRLAEQTFTLQRQ